MSAELKRWPIEERHQSRIRYNGRDPDKFLLVLLEQVGTFVLPGTDGSVLAPEILDPFVFLQFVAAIQGKYTINGSPFFGNWRLVGCARRMAESLFAFELEEALAQAEKQVAVYDEQVLDAYDACDFDWLDQHEEGLSERLNELLVNQFQPFIDAGECHYGTSGEGFNGGDRLLAALAEWITDEFPYEVLPNAQAVQSRLDAFQEKVSDVEAFQKAFTRLHLPEGAFEALKQLGYTFKRSAGSSHDGGRVPVSVQRFIVNNDVHLYLLTFLDARVIVEPSSMKVLTQWSYEWEGFASERVLSRVPRFADQPSIVIDPISLNSIIAPRVLAY